MAAGEPGQRTPSLPACSPSSSRTSPQTSMQARALQRTASAAGRPRLEDVWRKWEQQGELQEGGLPASKLKRFLSDMSISSADRNATVESVMAQSSQGLTYEQLQAMCSSLEPASPSCSTPDASEWQASQMPLKKCLSKNRAYLGTGYLVYDDTVVQYIRKLEDHRKKCEADGRYKEAKAAASRLVDLKTAQVARLRQELLIVQTQELAEVHKVYEEEAQKFNAVWDARIKDYHDNFARAVEELQTSHQRQAEQHVEDLSLKRPVKPKPSREYLNNKKIEASLAKMKEYKRATQVKNASEEMYNSELQQAQQAFDCDLRVKMAKLVAKQKVEMDCLAQRGVRGKSGLEMRRGNETERRLMRFRNIIMELENLHKLEVVSLENFLDGQVLAGKATPLEDGFRRKREQLFTSQF